MMVYLENEEEKKETPNSDHFFCFDKCRSK